MQFSENWLRTMVNPSMGSDALAHLLTMSGLEVEDTETVAPPFSHVVVAQVVSLEKHPNADRLNVCKVDVGTGELLTIVCGAPNVRAGMKVACAKAGAMLPPGADGKPFEIKVGELRGVESQGMLCSARELKLSEENSGLMDLPEDAPIGASIRDFLDLDDLKFTIKLTPNKADCLSVLGVAREVSALTGTALHVPSATAVPVTLTEILPVKVSAPDLCGRFSGRVIRGVNAKAPTPDWMKQRLERAGQRPISALVDISNYVMLELGQPSHVFDLDKLSGGIEVRWGKAGESIKLLNGNTVNVDPWIGVISTTGEAPILESLAGIMGGDATSVTLDTQNIYLEAAFWWPSAIQGRARRFNFSTDAAHRFERGVDFASTVAHIERITGLIVTICGGSVGPVDDQIINLPTRPPVKLRTARAIKVIGVALSDVQIADIFQRLGLPFTQEPDGFLVTPPSYRFDIEIEEDLIEEVARVYGFENIPALPPVAASAMRILPENTRSLFKVRRQIADLDYQEVLNYSFVEAAWEQDFANNANPIKVQNPIASHMSVMRTNLIASLVANARYNLNRKVSRIRIFEIAPVYLRDETVLDGGLTVAGFNEPKKLAGLSYGSQAEEQWGQATRQVDFFDVKADIEALFAPKTLRFSKVDHPALHPGRSAQIECDGKVVGVLGELHPALQQKYDLPLAPVVFELDAVALQAVGVPAYQEIPKFQAVTRDLALLVNQTVAVQDVLDVFMQERRLNPACLCVQAIVLFDEYRGKGLQDNEKSLAFRCTLQDTQSTLQEELIEAAMAALLSAAQTRCDAKLRS
ncbi:phenylalanine--tRNA ligase subunit beta [Solimicrobium silvestre]|uniref:Phenylalanine--tRNA ligase beta subunit n=1 Tax=Solimicrobium silvestre TaxID=2099400 RepID=A0A2S9GX38_9BURK|nr:phenylalanine--tRNA ligase subunit beta [Solimicrobium silvestre]PRC92285.1 Phenylalanine--tRNA ligase, beta subunit [Solimicrobium silvestre]